MDENKPGNEQSNVVRMSLRSIKGEKEIKVIPLTSRETAQRTVLIEGVNRVERKKRAGILRKILHFTGFSRRTRTEVGFDSSTNSTTTQKEQPTPQKSPGFETGLPWVVPPRTIPPIDPEWWEQREAPDIEALHKQQLADAKFAECAQQVLESFVPLARRSSALARRLIFVWEACTRFRYTSGNLWFQSWHEHLQDVDEYLREEALAFSRLPCGRIPEGLSYCIGASSREIRMQFPLWMFSLRPSNKKRNDQHNGRPWIHQTDFWNAVIDKMVPPEHGYPGRFANSDRNRQKNSMIEVTFYWAGRLEELTQYDVSDLVAALIRHQVIPSDKDGELDLRRTWIRIPASEPERVTVWIQTDADCKGGSSWDTNID